MVPSVLSDFSSFTLSIGRGTHGANSSDCVTIFPGGRTATSGMDCSTWRSRYADLAVVATRDISKIIVMTSDFNLNRFNRRGIWGSQFFNFNGTRWSSELRSKIKFPKDLDVEATLNYLSGYSTVDGERGPSRNINFGVRKKIADGRGVICLLYTSPSPRD